jgi:hypothetical protein
MALDRRDAELLFQVLTEREEKNSVAIASNESFGGNIIETGTDSCRLARTRPSPPPQAAPIEVTNNEHRSCSKRSTDAEIHEQATPPSPT